MSSVFHILKGVNEALTTGMEFLSFNFNFFFQSKIIKNIKFFNNFHIQNKNVIRLIGFKRGIVIDFT